VRDQVNHTIVLACLHLPCILDFVVDAVALNYIRLVWNGLSAFGLTIPFGLGKRVVDGLGGFVTTVLAARSINKTVYLLPSASSSTVVLCLVLHNLSAFGLSIPFGSGKGCRRHSSLQVLLGVLVIYLQWRELQLPDLSLFGPLQLLLLFWPTVALVCRDGRSHSYNGA
jgi:hypothetical protein